MVEVPFFALVDTGADTTICTRELAEILFQWDLRDKISIKCLEKTPVEHPCMFQTLCLKYGDFDFVKLSNVPFVETKLPYSECVPSNNLLDEYGLNGAQLCRDNVERRVDMILGSSDLRKFKVVETCVWKNSLNDPLLRTHPLGTIIWGQKVNTTSQHHVLWTLCLLSAVDIVSAEHNISSDKCLELLPLLESDLCRYYKDQLVLEPDHAEVIWNKEDENVLRIF